MAKTHDLKRRIRSIRNTMQVTKAMKMVSAARLRRAQDRIIAARPFAVTTAKVLSSLAARANPELHPLLVQRDIKKIELVLVTSDRGLCGSFNANAIKAVTINAPAKTSNKLENPPCGSSRPPPRRAKRRPSPSSPLSQPHRVRRCPR